MPAFILLVVVLLSHNCLYGAVTLPPPQPGVIAENPVGAGTGASLAFVEYIPAAQASHKRYKYPLIIQLHGQGLQGKKLKNVYTKWGAARIAHDHIADKNNNWTKAWDFDDHAGGRAAVLLAPLLPKGAVWNASGIRNTHEIVKAMLADRSRRIDPNRIYVIGFSLGGGGVWNYGNLFGDQIAGAVAIAPATIGLGEKYDLTRMSRMRVWVFQALDDKVTKWWWPRDQLTYMAVFAHGQDWGLPKLMSRYPGGEGKVFGKGDPSGHFPGADHPANPGKHYTAWFVSAQQGWRWNQGAVDDQKPDGWHIEGIGVPAAGKEAPWRFTLLHKGGHNIAGGPSLQNPDVWKWLYDMD